MDIGTGRLALGASLAVGMIVSTVIGGRALVQSRSDDLIQVTGSAKRRIRSDSITWSGRVSARGNDMKSAYRGLAAAVPKVTAYLESHGVPRAEIVISAVNTAELHPHDKEGGVIEDQINGYVMSQSVRVESKQVDRIDKIAREATELINEGVEIDSTPPQYRYTKIGDLKVQMLAEAAKDAKDRAQQIADSTDAHLGTLRSARMGVIQINAADSTEVSGEGNNDVSALDKDIITVVSATFALH